MYACRMQKDFDEWNIFKKILDEKEVSFYFKEREIRWCNLGLNIGKEINGKSKYFSRPVLILQKLNKYTCFIVPLTNTEKDTYHIKYIRFKNKISKINLGQIRTISSKRLDKYIGKIDQKVFKCIKIDLYKLFFKNTSPPSF